MQVTVIAERNEFAQNSLDRGLRIYPAIIEHNEDEKEAKPKPAEGRVRTEARRDSYPGFRISVRAHDLSCCQRK